MKSLTKEEALKKLQRYCVYQDRCHQEVRTKLLDLGIRGYDLEDIMAELVIDKFLDEERFAKSYVRGKFRNNKWGRIKIERELKQRNISAYCIKKGLAELDELDYEATLKELIFKKSATTKAPNPYSKNAKIAKYVIGKGYESSLVWRIIKEMNAGV